MVDPKLIEYVRSELSHGIPKEKIRTALITAGWSEADIGAAFEGSGTKLTHALSSGRTRQAFKKHDAYLGYALMSLVLGWGMCAASNGSIFFQIGNLFNLAGAVLALLALVEVFRKDPHSGNATSLFAKAFVLILSLAIIGWGGCWGFLGLSGGF